MSAVAIIPARGGSRRIPRKNIREFHGKPIIAYSIITARNCGLFDAVCVSTDDDEIAAIAIGHGAMILERSKWLADDYVGTQQVMQDALSVFSAQHMDQHYDHACCIYATCPMLTVEDLHDGYRALKKRVARYAFSVGADPLRDAGMFYWGTAKQLRVLSMRPFSSRLSIR